MLLILTAFQLVYLSFLNAFSQFTEEIVKQFEDLKKITFSTQLSKKN